MSDTGRSIVEGGALPQDVSGTSNSPHMFVVVFTHRLGAEKLTPWTTAGVFLQVSSQEAPHGIPERIVEYCRNPGFVQLSLLKSPQWIWSAWAIPLEAAASARMESIDRV
jgi:hypothetical protein